MSEKLTVDADTPVCGAGSLLYPDVQELIIVGRVRMVSSRMECALSLIHI